MAGSPGKNALMRPFALLAPLAVAALAAPLAMAQPCARPADLAAFDVASLKSQLMVTALMCNARDGYNAFVLRFRTDLMAQEHALQGYFARSYGGGGQQRHDDYVTQLANAHSQAAIRFGTSYCYRNVGLLGEVLSLPNGASLAGYAGAKGLVQPVALVSCATPREGSQVAQARDRR